MMSSEQAEQLALVVTGFHRSATSFTGNWLSNAGLHFGDDLLAANFANPKGYFEDRQAVSINNRALIDSGTSWQYHGEASLQFNQVSELDAYIKYRAMQHKQWAVKDPRICLFLNEWQQALVNNGVKAKFLLVIRHWATCSDSLFRRHSNVLATKAKLGKTNHFAFWQIDSLAQKMWLAYNQKLLEFYVANKDDCILITQRGLFELTDPTQLVPGFDIDPTCLDSALDRTLLREEAPIEIKDILPRGLRCQLDTLWEKLTYLAEIKSENECIDYQQTTPPVAATKPPVLASIDNPFYPYNSFDELLTVLKQEPIDNLGRMINWDIINADHFCRVLEGVDRNSYGALHQISKWLGTAGYDELFLTVSQFLVKQESNNIYYLSVAAIANQKLGKPADADKLMEIAFSIEPKHIFCRFTMANLYILRKLWHMAYAYSKVAVVQGESSPMWVSQQFAFILHRLDYSEELSQFTNEIDDPVFTRWVESSIASYNSTNVTKCMDAIGENLDESTLNRRLQFGVQSAHSETLSEDFVCRVLKRIRF
ncbi:hypothetical protein [Shewanella waksmanii]|uniref:hypothetical protein n=1 Tax=Shewanella waksmanii TaxID=213783 RepID=UPI0037353D75